MKTNKKECPPDLLEYFAYLQGILKGLGTFLSCFNEKNRSMIKAVPLLQFLFLFLREPKVWRVGAWQSDISIQNWIENIQFVQAQKKVQKWTWWKYVLIVKLMK